MCASVYLCASVDMLVGRSGKNAKQEGKKDRCDEREREREKKERWRTLDEKSRRGGGE